MMSVHSKKSTLHIYHSISFRQSHSFGIKKEVPKSFVSHSQVQKLEIKTDFINHGWKDCTEEKIC